MFPIVPYIILHAGRQNIQIRYLNAFVKSFYLGIDFAERLMSLDF